MPGAGAEQAVVEVLVEEEEMEEGRTKTLLMADQVKMAKEKQL
jgi:hypothetical protein